MDRIDVQGINFCLASACIVGVSSILDRGTHTFRLRSNTQGSSQWIGIHHARRRFWRARTRSAARPGRGTMTRAYREMYRVGSHRGVDASIAMAVVDARFISSSYRDEADERLRQSTRTLDVTFA